MVEKTIDNGSFADLVKENVSSIIKDPELRQLKPGSEEFKSGVNAKFAKTNETSESETLEDTSKVEVKVQNDEEATANSTDEPNNNDKLNVSESTQKRFNKLHRERQEAREETERLRVQIAELTSGKTQPEKEVAKSAQSSTYDKAKPSIDAFPTMEDYYDALTDWKLEKREFDRDVLTKQKETQNQQATSVEAFVKKGRDVERELGLSEGEFDVLVMDADNFKLSPAAQSKILKSEYGPRIAFDIASDEVLNAKFQAMDPVEQVAFIGKLEGKLEVAAESKKETKQVSSAKKPSKPLPKGTATVSTGNPLKNGGTMKDFEAWRNQDRIANGKTV